MSQTPHFTIYEPLRSLENNKSMNQKVDEIYEAITDFQLQNNTNTSTIGNILGMLNALADRVIALEKKELQRKEISER